MPEWMLYGANGYTGELIAREACRRGIMPIVAGRNRTRIERLAAELGCASRVFAIQGLSDKPAPLAGVRLLLNCGGPFSATAAPLMDACIHAGIHYLDITGELDVIEAAASRGEQAKRAGVTLLPAVGFDVVPSDCLAALLAAEFTSRYSGQSDSRYSGQAITATQLQLAISVLVDLSPGTAKTTLESLAVGGRVRIDGRIVRVPLAWKTREIPFAEGMRSAVTIPWGDVASAYYSTGIGNIEVYTTLPPKHLRWLRRWGWLLPLLRWRWLQRLAKGKIERTIRGPSAGDRAAGRASLWGRVENRAGHGVEATLTTPNGYDLTVLTALAGIERVLAGEVAPGFQTPSLAFGRDFIQTIPGVEYRLRAADGN